MKRLAAFFLVILTMTSCSEEEKTMVTEPQKPETEWIIYTRENSRLPDNQVNALAIDARDTKWAGTANGLVRIKNEDWTTFTSDNSPLPSGYISALAIEDNVEHSG